MFRSALWLAATLTLAACGAPRPASELRPAESPAAALERAVQRMAAAHTGADALWPGFDPLAVPLAVYDGTRTVLFRHPSPPAGYVAREGVPGAVVWVGRDSALVANSSAEIGGVLTATVILESPWRGSRADELASLVAHEAFHVFQRERHPGWSANEADLFVYPADDGAGLALQILEVDAMQRAADPSTYDAACWPRAALALRRQRFARLDSASVAYERGTELNEGLATYVGARAMAEPVVPPLDGTLDVRRRAYATGAALAFLLDHFASDWRASFEADDTQSLDGALERALDPGPTCEFSAAERREAQQRAAALVAQQAEARDATVARFASRPGPRVVVDARARPLWPQGFDPLNVERVAPARVLHRRYLTLGNEAGQVEMLGETAGDIEALTDGAGPHPLFNGVVRVELAGVGPTTTSDEEGHVTLRASGLALTFENASVRRDGETVTVTLVP